MSHSVLGLDIGGANLKAAHSDGAARTVPFALWKQPDRLHIELKHLRATMPPHSRLAVTMTGELCDCFASKREGVASILEEVRRIAEGLPIRVWTTQRRFLDCDAALHEVHSVAAANWLALATDVAMQYPLERVLLLDTGSTTTDILYLEKGCPMPRALTDLGRLNSGELVYTGVRRTPICAVLGMEVAAEFFATMLDAYLLGDDLPEGTTDHDTADGRPATRPFAHARLARMRCADAESFTLDDARELARRALGRQWDGVENAIERVLAGRETPQRVVVAGSGAILGQRVLGRHRDWCRWPIVALADRLGPALSDAACAYAVARLAACEE